MPGSGTHSGARDHLFEQFAQVVSPLTEGELTFRPPFDLSSAAALALNIDVGALAEELFRVTAARETGYVVQIHARAGDVPELADREIIDTSVDGTRQLIALLEVLIEELLTRLEQE